MHQLHNFEERTN